MGNVIHNDIDGQINRILRTLLKISLQFPTGGMPARERPGPPKEDMLKEDMSNDVLPMEGMLKENTAPQTGPEGPQFVVKPPTWC